MAPAALALVLASALLHAAWNALLKRHERADDAGAATAAVLAVAAAAALAAALLDGAPGFPRASGAAWGAGAGVCEGGYFATLALALARAPLGLAYTIARGGAILLVWPVSALWLGERVTVGGAVGAAIVGGGLWAVAGSETETGTGTGTGTRTGTRVGVLWAVLCAVFIAGYHLCYKQALAREARPAALFALSLAIALPINVVCLGRGGVSRALGRLRVAPAALAGAGVICTAAFLLFLAALASAGAGAVLTLRNTSVVFAQGFAWTLGERPGRRQIGGAVLVAAGAALLGWGR